MAARRTTLYVLSDEAYRAELETLTGETIEDVTSFTDSRLYKDCPNRYMAGVELAKKMEHVGNFASVTHPRGDITTIEAWLIRFSRGPIESLLTNGFDKVYAIGEDEINLMRELKKAKDGGCAHGH